MADNKNIIIIVDGVEELNISVPKSNFDCYMMHLRPWTRRNFKYAKDVKISIGLSKLEKTLDNEIAKEEIKAMHLAGRNVNWIAKHFKVTRRFIGDVIENKDQINNG